MAIEFKSLKVLGVGSCEENAYNDEPSDAFSFNPRLALGVGVVGFLFLLLECRF